ncbi:MAG: dockerin type I repeat-containing protein [Clostridia bacterium]|nr:dockerin type I repeat-containing protein [Clostridia bacterium]
MNRKHVLSALMAIMMVISMMAVIAVPVSAEDEETVDLSAVPSVMTATAGDSVKAYKIETLDDLIFVGKNPGNFPAGDTIYFANDLDIDDYGTMANFADDFPGINAIYCYFDGLGHTIYNYKDTHGVFIGNYYGQSIKNINMVGAEITGMTQLGGILTGKIDRDTVFENVHIRDCYVEQVSYGYYVGGIFGTINTKNGYDITMINCSVTGTEFVSTCNTKSAGLLVGRFASGGGVLTLENVLVANNSMSGFASTSSNPSSLLVGEIRQHTSVGSVCNAKNVGIYDNTYTNYTGYMPGLIAPLVDAASIVNADNVYAANNWMSSAEGMEEADVPTSAFVMNIGAGTVGLGNYYVSEGAEYTIYDTRGEDYCELVDPARVLSSFNIGDGLNLMNENVGTGNNSWGLNSDGNPIPLPAGGKTPMSMTFIDSAGLTNMFNTDVDGKLIATKAVLKQIKKSYWVDSHGNPYAAKFAWEEKVFEEEDTYTAHRLEIVSNGDQTHNVTCLDAEGCPETVLNKPCTGVEIEELRKEATYYTKVSRTYECSECGYTWTVEDDTQECPAAIALDFDKDEYDANTHVEVSVNRMVNTYMIGFTGILTYDVNQLTYNNFQIEDNAYFCQVNPISDGELKIVITSIDGTPVNDEGTWLYLNFTSAAETAVDVETAATLVLEQVVIKEGEDAPAKKVIDQVQVKTVSDTAVLLAAFLAGDVNNDGSVTLLDAVYLIEKLEGTISEEHAAVFVVRAANVDGADNEVTTNDVTYLLRHLTDWSGAYETLNHSAPRPSIVTVAQ